MTNERHLLTKREALLCRGDARRMGMSFRLMLRARVALTPVKGARENATCGTVGTGRQFPRSGNLPAGLAPQRSGFPPTVFDR
ncbi:hypothetical protein SD81_000420 [Tolypothrix campylonemoides VB511288]|nr:hypothetical protein SD81_000420 [Tolypothrix campylonemoides VB511288]